MKIRWTTHLFLFLLAACCLDFQVQHFWGSGKAADRYPPGFPDMTKLAGARSRADSLLAADLYQSAWKFYYKTQYDSLAQVCKELFPIAEHLLTQGYDSTTYEFWAMGYSGYGMALMYLGDIEEGSRIMVEFDSIDRRVYPNDYIGRSMTYFGLGHMARDLFKDYDLALDYYKLGQAVAQNCLPKDDRFFINVNLVLGCFYGQMGDYGTQAKYFDKILASDPNMRQVLPHYIALNYQNAGDYENAIRYRNLANEQTPAPLSVYYQNCELTECYLMIGDLANSRRCLRICEQLFYRHQAEIRTRDIGASYFYAKAVFQTAMKQYPEAIAGFRKSLAASESSGGGKQSNLSFTIFHKLTETLLLADSLPGAQAAVQELLAREAGGFQSPDFTRNPPLKAFSRQPYHLRTLELKGRCFEKMFDQTGDPAPLQHALQTYALADSLIDNIRDTYRGTGSKNEFSGKAKAIFQRTIHCAYRLWQHNGDPQFLSRAWQAAEKSKAVALLESLRESESKQLSGFRPEDLAHEKRLKRDLDFYEKFSFDEQAKPQPDTVRLFRWNRHIFNLKATQDSLLLVFQRRYPEYHRLKYDRRLATVAEVQARLPAGNALVEYFLGDSVLFTFLIEKGQVQLFQQKTDSSWLHHFEVLRATVHYFDPAVLQTGQQKANDFQRFASSSHALYRLLLAEPLTHSKAQRLVIVPDEQIGYVPFAALLQRPVGASTTPDYRQLPYLVRDRALRLEYSATLLTRQIASGEHRQPGYLGMAPAYQGQAIAARALPDSLRFTRAFGSLRGGTVPALRYNAAEIDSTVRIFQGESASGTAATEAYFKAHAPDAGILHLAMHALTNDADPLYSTLVFSNPNPADSTGENDGFLHAYELYKLRLQAQLAVLSACNTGAGKVVRGEGIMSLARAFRFAGCPSVMMSLWSVNDWTAKDLVVGFFQKLSQGMEKSLALQSAQRDFLDTNTSDEFMHPYYWATFSLVGDDAPLRSGADGRPWLYAWGLLLVAFLVLYFWSANKSQAKEPFS